MTTQTDLVNYRRFSRKNGISILEDAIIPWCLELDPSLVVLEEQKFNGCLKKSYEDFNKAGPVPFNEGENKSSLAACQVF